MAVAILQGSARSDGNTRKIVEHIRSFVEADFFDLNEYQVGFYDYEHNQQDDFPALMDRLVDYDHLILATPVYWYSMSGQMKTFFDRLTDLLEIHVPLHQRWQGKTLLVLSCGPDNDVPDFFDRAFSASAAYLNLQFGGWVHTWLENGELNAERKTAIQNWLQKEELL